MESEEKLKLIIYLIVIVAIVGSFIGLSSNTTNMIIQWLLSIFVGILTSMIAGRIVEAFTGNLLKIILINIPITDDFSISISVFVITVIVVKFLLFGF